MQVLEEYGVTFAEAQRRQKRKLNAARKERARMARQIERERAVEEMLTAPREVFETRHGPAYAVNMPINYGIYSGKGGSAVRFTRVTLPFISALGR